MRDLQDTHKLNAKAYSKLKAQYEQSKGRTPFAPAGQANGPTPFGNPNPSYTSTPHAATPSILDPCQGRGNATRPNGLNLQQRSWPPDNGSALGSTHNRSASSAHDGRPRTVFKKPSRAGTVTPRPTVSGFGAGFLGQAGAGDGGGARQGFGQPSNGQFKSQLDTPRRRGSSDQNGSPTHSVTAEGSNYFGQPASQPRAPLHG